MIAIYFSSKKARAKRCVVDYQIIDGLVVDYYHHRGHNLLPKTMPNCNFGFAKAYLCMSAKDVITSKFNLNAN